MGTLFAEVGMKGTLTALSPFDTIIKENVIYECLTVSSLKGLLASGEDGFELYYKPYGITQTIYDIDVESNVKILTLQSYDGQSVKVPTSFVSGLPDPSGVVYQMKALSIPISALPADVDLSTLKSDIADIVKKRLGVSCTIQELTYGSDFTLTQDEHTAYSQYRSTQITDTSSNLVRLEQLNTLLNDQRVKLQALESYIASNLTT